MGDVAVLIKSSAEVALFRRWCDSNRGVTVISAYSPEDIECQVKQCIPEKQWAENQDAFVCACSGVVDVVLIFASGLVQPMSFRSGAYRFLFGDLGTVVEKLRAVGVRNFEFKGGCFDAAIGVDKCLENYSGVHQGERCFVIGNGPSLAQTDMSLLRSEITFGSNRCYLGFEEWGYAFRYWACTDRLQIEEYAEDYENNLPEEVVKFVPTDYFGFSRHKNQCFFNQSYQVLEEPLFSRMPDIIHMGNTVTYSLMQIAAVMGVRQIILLGVDHKYPVARNLNKTGERSSAKGVIKRMGKQVFGGTRMWRVVGAAWHEATKKDAAVSEGAGKAETWRVDNTHGQTHFDPRYTSGSRFIPPRFLEMERAFKAARKWCDSNNIEVLNATPGSALDIFPKVDLDSLF